MMWIMVAGPYRAGTTDPAARSTNLDRLNEAAVALFRAGHVPIVGEWLALPLESVWRLHWRPICCALHQ